MPKRRMTPARRAAIGTWQRAAWKANMEASGGSWSAPRVSKTGGPVASSAYRRAGRTPKLRGKAAFHHTGSNVTLAPWAQQALAGKTITESAKVFAPSAIRGDITQAKGVPYRRKPKPKPKPKKHHASYKGHQLTKKVNGQIVKKGK